MTTDDLPPNARLAVLVNKYAMPLAVLLGALGVLFSGAQPFDRNLTLALLVFGIVFNVLTVRHIKKTKTLTSFMTQLRLSVNIWTNTAMVYFLGKTWPPMWLLLALTPIASAIYGDRRKTLIVSGGISGIILMIHAARFSRSAAEWGQHLAYTAFIMLVSLLINELSHLPVKPQGN